MKKRIGIYKITSPSGRVYIGQSWNIDHRIYNYRKYRCEGQRKLHNSFLKYGTESHSFEIIHELPNDISQTIMDEFEQLYMDLYQDCGIQLLNIRKAGSRGRHSNETKEKIRLSNTGKVSYWKGKNLPEEAKQKIREANLGKTMPKEVVEKMQATRKKNGSYPKWTEQQKINRSRLMKGRKYSNEHCRNISKGHMGMRYSEERNEKVRQANINQKRSAEAKRKMSQAKIGKRPSPQAVEALKKANAGNKHRLGIRHSEEGRRKISEGLRQFNKNKRNGVSN
jgi:group I intron endonuclease